jgi:hypothetical protein
MAAQAATLTPEHTVAEVDRTSSGPPRWIPTVAVLAGYLALGVIAYWPAVTSGSSRLFGTTSDSILATWFLAWLPHAAAHGLNPFFSNAMFVPGGVNLAQNTEAPLLGALTVPLAAFLGPIARANLLMVLAMPACATSAYYVLRKWNIWRPAAALGGLVYGFSPYMVGQGLGHLVLVFAPWPPLIALTLSRIVERRGSPIRSGVLLGLLVVAQFLCEPEILTIVLIVAVVALAGTVLRHPAGANEVIRRLAVPGAIGMGLAAVLLAYPIWMIVAGPQHYTGAPQGTTNPYFNDLLSFVAPGPLQHLSFGLRGLGQRLIAGDAFETNGYLGIPVLVAAGLLAWRSRRRSRTQLALLCGLTSGVLSLGPHLSVAGHGTSVPLPFLLLTHVPLVDNILPGRFSLVTAASIAALLAFGLDDLRRSPSPVIGEYGASGRQVSRRTLAQHRARAGLAALVVLVALVVTQLPRWPYATQTVASLPSGISHAIPPGDPIALTYPYAQEGAAAAMSWQLTDGFRFRLLGGYAEHPDVIDTFYVFPARMHPGALQRFLANQEGFTLYGPAPALDQSLVDSTRATLAAYDVRLVIVDRATHGSAPAMRLFTAALGPPQRVSGNFALWASHSSPL